MANEIILTMYEDLARALGKNPEERKWSMLIDLRKCVGCHGCTVACMSENKTPPKVQYRPVYEYEQGKFPKVVRTFLPRPCMQCDTPPCVEKCPLKGSATWKETKGIAAGLVQIDYTHCIGCQKCVPACPYDARTIDSGANYNVDENNVAMAYENGTNFEYGRVMKRDGKHLPVGTARKCHFCQHRVKEGMLPECVTTCIGRATYFGDINDKTSEIAKVYEANKDKIQILKPSKKTDPRVFYIAATDLRGVYGK